MSCRNRAFFDSKRMFSYLVSGISYFVARYERQDTRYASLCPKSQKEAREVWDRKIVDARPQCLTAILPTSGEFNRHRSNWVYTTIRQAPAELGLGRGAIKNYKLCAGSIAPDTIFLKRSNSASEYCSCASKPLSRIFPSSLALCRLYCRAPSTRERISSRSPTE